MGHYRHKKYPPLSREQQKLVVEHRWIAGRLAYGAQCHTGGVTGSLTRDDLESVGLFALCVAASTYNPDMGVKYSTYAWGKARGDIQHALRDFSRMVRTPRWVSVYKKRVDKMLEEGCMYEDIAEELDIGVALVMMCAESSFNYHVSFDTTPNGEGGRDFEFLDDEAKATLITPTLLKSLRDLSDAEMRMMERYVDNAPLSDDEREWCSEKFHELQNIAYGRQEED